MFKRIIKIILVINIIFSLSACFSNNDYSNYDIEHFEELLDELVEKANNNESSKTIELYRKAYNDLLKIEDLYNYNSLNSDKDIYSLEYNEKTLKAYDMCILAEDLFSSALHKVSLSPCKEELRKQINNDKVFNKILEYKEKSKELKDLYSKENMLIEEYESLDVDSDDFTNIASAIFMKLLPIRDEIAHLEGYDNYAIYCDHEIYGRDFSAFELNNIYAVAKQYSMKAGYLFSYYYDLVPEYENSENVFVDLKKCIDGISILSIEAYNKMLNNDELYYYTQANNSLNAAYTTFFYNTRLPYIYLHGDNTSLTLSSAVHEFGHFTNVLYSFEPYPVFCVPSFDIFEIHSTGLQLLAKDNYAKVVEDENGYLETFIVSDLLTYVCDGCFYDEWQRHIYENPNMTLEEINAYFAKLSKEYGYVNLNEEYWTCINHNISSPMYYLSYATSAYASLQIFETSLDDYKTAVSIWEDVVTIGAYDYSYNELLAMVNLYDLRNYCNIEDVIKKAVDYCYQKVEV